MFCSKYTGKCGKWFYPSADSKGAQLPPEAPKLSAVPSERFIRTKKLLDEHFDALTAKAAEGVLAENILREINHTTNWVYEHRSKILACNPDYGFKHMVFYNKIRDARIEIHTVGYGKEMRSRISGLGIENMGLPVQNMICSALLEHCIGLVMLVTLMQQYEETKGKKP